jgi:hypothetical protein
MKDGACFLPEPLAAWRRAPVTYSAQVLTDASASKALVDHAVSLMETRYRGVFPPGYARAWRREMAFNSARLRMNVQQLGFQEDVAPGGPGGAVRPVARWSSMAGRARKAAVTSYLVVRHRPSQAVRRLARHLLWQRPLVNQIARQAAAP